MNFEVIETGIIVTLTNLSTQWCLQADGVFGYLLINFSYIL